MNRKLTYNKWVKYIHNYQLNKNKQMKVKIQQRSVYHKFTEIEIEVPTLIDQETEVQEWLMENEDLWSAEMDDAVYKSEYVFGTGLGDYGGMDQDGDSEWRYQCPDGYGGHL